MTDGRIVLVTGTDTGVGKSVAAVWLAAQLASRQQIALIKAAQTGTTEPARDGDEAFYRRTLAGSGVTIETLVSLPEPLAPSIAARRAGTAIDFEALVTRCREIATAHELTLIEGSGGLLVTLTDRKDVADLALALEAALVLVLRPGLGTLNHTLLTVEAARRRGLAVELLVCSDYPHQPGVVEQENLRFLRERCPNVPLLVLQRTELDGLADLARLPAQLYGPPAAILEPIDLAQLPDSALIEGTPR